MREEEGGNGKEPEAGGERGAEGLPDWLRPHLGDAVTPSQGASGQAGAGLGGYLRAQEISGIYGNGNSGQRSPQIKM